MAGFTRTRVTGHVGVSTYPTVTGPGTPLGPEVGRNSRTDADMNGIKGAFGRGETDTDITYFEAMNENGTPCFIYPNAAGNGILVSTTRP